LVLYIYLAGDHFTVATLPIVSQSIVGLQDKFRPLRFL
jgi:hypothetical protein